MSLFFHYLFLMPANKLDGWGLDLSFLYFLHRVTDVAFSINNELLQYLLLSCLLVVYSLQYIYRKSISKQRDVKILVRIPVKDENIGSSSQHNGYIYIFSIVRALLGNSDYKSCLFLSLSTFIWSLLRPFPVSRLFFFFQTNNHSQLLKDFKLLNTE